MRDKGTHILDEIVGFGYSASEAKDSRFLLEIAL